MMAKTDEQAYLSASKDTLDWGPAEQILQELSPLTESAIIPLLQRLQDAYGYIPRDIVLEICRRTGLPASRMFGVATFYAQFHLQPRGRHVIRCCRGTACHVRGGKKVYQTVSQLLGIQENETTADLKFTLETVACLGACALAPVLVVNNTYYGKMNAQRVEKLLQQLAQEKL